MQIQRMYALLKMPDYILFEFFFICILNHCTKKHQNSKAGYLHVERTRRDFKICAICVATKDSYFEGTNHYVFLKDKCYFRLDKQTFPNPKD